MIFQIGMFPGVNADSPDHPLLTLITQSIAAQGWTVAPVTAAQIIAPSSLTAANIALLHLHWPSSFFYFTRRGLDRLFPINHLLARGTMARIDRWAEQMRSVPLPLIWEVHDLVSHHWLDKGPFAAVDEHLHRTVYELSSAIIVHEASCLPPVFAFYGSTKPYAVARLGDYAAIHGAPRDKAAARAQLGIEPASRVLAYVGTARRNRNPRAAIAAFRAVAGPADRLIVAGRVVGKFSGGSRDNRMMIFDGPQPNDRLRDIFCAADFIINDAQRYLTSAVLRTAMSYGVPVIAYPYGSALDMVAGAAIFIEDRSDGLQEAMQRALTIATADYQIMVQHARMNNQVRRWSDFGVACAGLYEQVSIG